MRKKLLKAQQFINDFEVGNILFCLLGISLFISLLVSIYIASGWLVLLLYLLIYIHVFMLYKNCISTVQSIKRSVKRRRAYKGLQKLMAEVKRDYLS